MDVSLSKEYTFKLNEDELDVILAALRSVKPGRPYYSGELSPAFPAVYRERAAQIYNQIVRVTDDE